MLAFGEMWKIVLLRAFLIVSDRDSKFMSLSQEVVIIDAITKSQEGNYGADLGVIQIQGLGNHQESVFSSTSPILATPGPLLISSFIC